MGELIIAIWTAVIVLSIAACGFARAGDRRRQTEEQIARAMRREVLLNHPRNTD